MKPTVLATAAVLLIGGSAFAGAARLSFQRRISATHDLGRAEQLAVVYAIGDTEKVNDFIGDYVDALERSGAFRIENAVDSNHHVRPGDVHFPDLRRSHPADVYIGVKRFNCTAREMSAEGSERDNGGERVKRVHHWVDAACQARLDVMNPDGKRLFSYAVRGEGTSPRAATLTADEREVAYDQAARYAAIAAAEAITPRSVRESIELEENAPAFDEGYAMIEAGRLAEARALWEAAIQRHRDSASLHFNLGALCEAAGDLTAARDYYQSAVRLSPSERRYARELDLFRLRNPKK